MTAKRKLKNAVLYLRASSKKQDTSVAEQRVALEKYAKEKGYKIVDEYVDDGISGDDTENRSGFLQMREDAASHRFHVILCWDQDRYGRFDSIDAGYYTKPIRDAGVSLETANEGLCDWEDSIGRSMYGLKQEGKHQFLHDLSRNVTRGIIESAKSGSWHGKAPFGYEIVGERKHKRLEVVPGKSAIVQRIFREYVQEGNSMNQIAKRLTADGIPTSTVKKKKWDCGSVRFILENRAYVGDRVANKQTRAKYNHIQGEEVVAGSKQGKNDPKDWIIVEGTHEAIIDPETFAKAQAERANGTKRNNQHPPESNPYLFTGVLRCGSCGANMHGEKQTSNGRRFYECSEQKKDRNACTGSKIPQDKLIETIVETIDQEFGSKLMGRFCGTRQGFDRRLDQASDLIAKLERMLLPPKSAKVNLASLKKQIANLEGRIKTARRNLAAINDPKNIPAIEDQIRTWESNCDELRKSVTNQPNEKTIRARVREIFQALAELQTQDEDLVRRVAKQIDKIVIRCGRSGKRGNGIRYHFRCGEIHFNRVGAVGSESNSHRSD